MRILSWQAFCFHSSFFGGVHVCWAFFAEILNVFPIFIRRVKLVQSIGLSSGLHLEKALEHVLHFFNDRLLVTK